MSSKRDAGTHVRTKRLFAVFGSLGLLIVALGIISLVAGAVARGLVLVVVGSAETWVAWVRLPRRYGESDETP